MSLIAALLVTVGVLGVNALSEIDAREQCLCGNSIKSLNTRVVGGQNAIEGLFPYAVGLIDRNIWSETGRESRPYCGGTLITDRHVITAAHCFKVRKPEFVVADVGDYNLDGKTDAESLFRNIKSVLKHPDYIPGYFYNDVAIVELDTPVPLGQDGIKTAWLPPPNLPVDPGTTVIVYGWGRLQYSGGQPSILQTLEMPVIESSKCQTKFVTTITESMLCAGGISGHDACIGDSGSGLAVHLDDEMVLVGIVSFGRSCALPGVPGVYTRISSYTDWIYENTRNSECKPCIYGL